MSQQGRPDVAAILAGLKDFQQATVDYVFKRLYVDPQPAKRFLIADEVGLGKTLVAKGVVARAVDRLWDKGGRIDILYICSNRDIANQNIRSLNFTGEEHAAFASRITMLPLETDLLNRRLNFVSFTPSTSFRTGFTCGICEERVLLYHLLRHAWQFPDTPGYRLVLKDGVRWERWTAEIDHPRNDRIDPALADAFAAALQAHPDLQESFLNLAARFGRKRIYKLSDEERGEALPLIGRLRTLLANTCVEALEPDIIILDEFQRFRDLLDGDTEAAELANTLFNYKDAKVLLLSATPYKMYTLNQESAEDDHYRDFLRTVRFLLDDEGQTAAFENDLATYRRSLLRAADGGLDGLRSARLTVEAKLRGMMVRTERLTMTAERDNMLVESRQDLGGLHPRDLRSFRLVDAVAQQLDLPDTVEYWKSAPYLLNLMDDSYQVKRRFKQQVESGDTELAAILAQGQEHLLTFDEIAHYGQVDPGNAKLRTMLQNTVETGAWQLLWVPPSLPYYRPAAGPYAAPELQSFTKALVFSAWKVVPKVIALLTSYEVERRMVTGFDPKADYQEERRRRRALIRFARDERRLTGMINFTLLYPCWTLAQRIDPLLIGAARSQNGAPPDQETVELGVRNHIRALLKPILPAEPANDGPVDERWYWAALVLLDRRYVAGPVRDWFGRDDNYLAWHRMGTGLDDEDGQQSLFAEHVQQLYTWLDGGEPLGRPPADLLDILTWIALASPAVTLLRALMRLGTAEETEAQAVALLAGAAYGALSFRTLFNLPDSITLLRTGRSEPYWQTVLAYCVSGNLQAVVDEYVHVLHDTPGLMGKGLTERVGQVADQLADVVALRTSNLEFDQFCSAGEHVTPSTHHVRCRFALRFGDGKEAETNEEYRADYVRKAFNSPFRPFVLASTSIGQEGLDFHRYCHEIYHWNLPANPVDLEQREGRIHRYKGHVIRKNIARAIGLGGLRGAPQPAGDPWIRLFDAAAQSRMPGQNELVPYWVFEAEGGAKVIRHVPALPLSRDRLKLEDLRRTLAAYRMVFGQPRQEDLLNYLKARLTENQLDELLAERIDLSPSSWLGEREKAAD